MAHSVRDAQSCALCHRHFLGGEAVTLYREPGSQTLRRVCPLCRTNATRHGWEICEATRELPLRVPSDPARLEVLERRDRLVERLQGQLDQTQRELVSTRGSLEVVEQRAVEAERERSELRALTGALRERDRALENAERERDDLAREVDRLSQALAQASLAERRLERADRRVAELEAEIAELSAERARLERVRRREADAAYLRGVAAEAFNRSEHTGLVARAARSLGEPRCRLQIDGITLPRVVRAIFVWERAWIEFLVQLDLAARSVQVTERGRGDDPSQLAGALLDQNAYWTPANGLIPSA